MFHRKRDSSHFLSLYLFPNKNSRGVRPTTRPCATLSGETSRQFYIHLSWSIQKQERCFETVHFPLRVCKKHRSHVDIRNTDTVVDLVVDATGSSILACLKGAKRSVNGYGMLIRSKKTCQGCQNSAWWGVRKLVCHIVEDSSEPIFQCYHRASLRAEETSPPKNPTQLDSTLYKSTSHRSLRCDTSHGAPFLKTKPAAAASSNKTHRAASISTARVYFVMETSNTHPHPMKKREESPSKPNSFDRQRS